MSGLLAPLAALTSWCLFGRANPSAGLGLLGQLTALIKERNLGPVTLRGILGGAD